MNLAILPILLVVTEWRFAARPFVLRRLILKQWVPTPRSVFVMFAIWFVELLVAIVLCFAWPAWAWLSISIILVGQELRHWIYFARVPKPGKAQV